MRNIFHRRYFSRRALNFVDKCEKLKLGAIEVSTEDRRLELSEVLSGTKLDIFQGSPLLPPKIYIFLSKLLPVPFYSYRFPPLRKSNDNLV